MFRYCPMTLSYSSTDFENDSDFLPTLPDVVSDSHVALRCLYRLLITCRFPLQA